MWELQVSCVSHDRTKSVKVSKCGMRQLFKKFLPAAMLRVLQQFLGVHFDTRVVRNPKIEGVISGKVCTKGDGRAFRIPIIADAFRLQEQSYTCENTWNSNVIHSSNVVHNFWLQRVQLVHAVR